MYSPFPSTKYPVHHATKTGGPQYSGTKTGSRIFRTGEPNNIAIAMASSLRRTVSKSLAPRAREDLDASLSAILTARRELVEDMLNDHLECTTFGVYDGNVQVVARPGSLLAMSEHTMTALVVVPQCCPLVSFVQKCSISESCCPLAPYLSACSASGLLVSGLGAC